MSSYEVLGLMLSLAKTKLFVVGGVYWQDVSASEH